MHRPRRSSVSTRFGLAAALVVPTLLAACGQKGPLTLPAAVPPPPSRQATMPATAPITAPATAASAPTLPR